MSAELKSLQSGFGDYKEFFDRIGKEKAVLEEKIGCLESLIETKKGEFVKATSLINVLRTENEKLRGESENLIRRTEDKLKVGQNALESVECFQSENFDLKVKLNDALGELESLKKTHDKTASVNYEMSLEVERLKSTVEEMTSETEYGRKLCEENQDTRRKLRSLRE